MERISAATDPEGASALAARIMAEANQEDTASQGPPIVEVPFIDPPPDTTVRLPGGGLLDPDGTVHDVAVVRELNGADEEVLSKIEANKSQIKFVQTLVRLGTESIGDYSKLDDKLMGELLVGDRETLLLAIRRATYGDEMNLTLVCPSCVSAVEAKFDLASEIPIKELEHPNRRVEVKLRNGQVAVLGIPTAADQDAILSMPGKTNAEMNTALIGRCLITIDGMPATGRSAALGLGAVDRRKISEALVEAQPGPKYGEVNLDCPGCGREFPLQVGLAELFRG